MVRSAHRHHSLVVSWWGVIVIIIIVVALIIRGRQWLIRCRVKNMSEKRHSDQDGMSARIAGTKETKDTVLSQVWTN